MSKRIYPSAAEKQRAYRERLRSNDPAPTPSQPQPKRRSRPERLTALEAAARDLADEYQQWLDGIPENLAGGTMADELRQVVAQLEAVAADLGAIEPPRVGRH